MSTRFIGDVTPITNEILRQFQTSNVALVDASDLDWAPGVWPRHFYILGRENAFNFFRDTLDVTGGLRSKVYQDSIGYQIIVMND